jgi:hypothetical protein
MPLLAGLVLALALQSAPESLVLEIRVFDGAVDVTGETRIAVHRAGERGEPVALIPTADRRALVTVPPGIYDAQAIRELHGAVVSIRWAERLVVMPYPDEHGRHLEVINFVNGYGALQIRGRGAGSPSDVTLVGPDGAESAAGVIDRDDDLLFVVPAGHYDLRVTRSGRTVWFRKFLVPLDRTRLWLLP